MAFPKINIIFKSIASTMIKRGNKGIVYVILKDVVGVKGTYEMVSAADVPAGLSTYNKAQLAFIFQGGVNTPKKVIAFVQETAATDIVAALKYAEAVKFDYLCVPGASVAECTAAASAVKSMRDNLAKRVKAVLPHTVGDSEAVINFDTDGIVVDGTTYAAKDFCSRITGVLAGTPLTSSVTFTVLADVTDVPRMSQTDAGAAIDAGKLILFHDGEKVKIARGVNSLTTLSASKGDQFKKIKIVDILDLMHEDIRRTAEDTYIGHVSNSYENKCLLINAINAYFEELENEGILARKGNSCYMDIDAQRTYLKSLGINLDNKTEDEVKTADTRDKVFLAAVVKPVDSMEEIEFNVTL